MPMVWREMPLFSQDKNAEMRAMIVIHTILPTPEENLALEEALVEVADAHMWEDASGAETGPLPELLRLWEMPTHCVVLGRSSNLATETFSEKCASNAIPILRRASGGSSILAGPGCLMYSLLLSYQARPSLRMLDNAHLEVMTRTKQAVQACLNNLHIDGQVELQGTCDLTIGSRKFSGNALRCKRNWMLYHGTLLYAMDTSLISKYLNQPPRQPDYRAGRVHDHFVRNIVDSHSAIGAETIRVELENQLIAEWQATNAVLPHPFATQLAETCSSLLINKYLTAEWNTGRTQS